ncbi:hypothetical protein R3W88_011333 [Solanum pinnatisectum]|uniref:Serine carboxypeptidase-like 18 n=1 Tax=Solanum pinnatisectum TaxID=50273 RepID=A0AAV9L9I4_9SOLN|nr:hypothetical protein R3W88_011333 [Solanum pinnatisectum]
MVLVVIVFILMLLLTDVVSSHFIVETLPGFDEQLPFKLETGKVANIIFIDQPVGTGYSYAKTSEAYNSNDTLSATLTYDFLRKWLMDHPEYLKNPLYVGGDSYSGIYIALVTRKIYDGVEVGDEPQMNIKGHIQGNALTDRYITMNSRVKYAHHMGLISDKIYQSAKANCNGNYVDIDPNNILCLNDLQKVKKCLNNIRRNHILENWCELSFLMSNVHSGPWCRENNYIYSKIWANDKAVQKALSHEIRGGMKRSESYVYDIQTSIDDHCHLTSKSCRALIYSGDHDMTIPHLSTEEWIDTLKLPIVDDWEPWFIEDQVAGYKVKYLQNDYELTYVTIKGAGHTTPEYKPQQCLPMVDRWFSGDPL